MDPGIKTAGSPKLAPWELRFTSYDVEAFEVPRGREEQWRFTPLRRLRGLHDASVTADGRIDVSVVSGFGDAAADLTGSAPVTRPSDATTPGSATAASPPTASRRRRGRRSPRPTWSR